MAHLHDVIAPRQRMIPQTRWLFFDKEQLHHGDEPYTYTNLCILLVNKNHSMIIDRDKIDE